MLAIAAVCFNRRAALWAMAVMNLPHQVHTSGIGPRVRVFFQPLSFVFGKCVDCAALRAGKKILLAKTKEGNKKERELLKGIRQVGVYRPTAGHGTTPLA